MEKKRETTTPADAVAPVIEFDVMPDSALLGVVRRMARSGPSIEAVDGIVGLHSRWRTLHGYRRLPARAVISAVLEGIVDG